mmetsp:Transcript_19828/g.47850  ORF Transcript_19828/g.47850 Transcript_19828/m.47850 type:complete len:80 (-) Transcript_19828:51-290(-)
MSTAAATRIVLGTTWNGTAKLTSRAESESSKSRRDGVHGDVGGKDLSFQWQPVDHRRFIPLNVDHCTDNVTVVLQKDSF